MPTSRSASLSPPSNTRPSPKSFAMSISSRRSRCPKRGRRSDRIEQPVPLGNLRAAALQGAVREAVAFQDPAELGFFDSPRPRLGDQPGGDDQAQAPLLILGDYIGADQADALYALFVPEQADESNREQAAVDQFDAAVVVEQAELCADRAS